MILSHPLPAPPNTDTYQWSCVHDGTAPDTPCVRQGHALVADPMRSRILCFGGLNGSRSFSDLYEFSLRIAYTFILHFPLLLIL